MAVILITHSMEEAARYADRLLVMSGGRLHLDGPARQIFTNDKEKLRSLSMDIPESVKLAEELKAGGLPLKGTPLTREELIRLLGERENNAGGGSALRMVRLRARRLLEPLEAMTGAELCLVREGSIIWNPDVPMEVDAEQFEALCRRAAEEKNKNKLVDLYCKALSLYDGSFLEKLSAEPWVRPLTAYYQGMYLTALEEAMPLLLEAGCLEEINRFGQVAVKISPYEEILYAFQMRALIAAGNYAAAEEIHRNVYQLLSNDLGVTPSEDLQELHMEALRHMDETVISEDLLLQSLREQRDSSGAMVCDFRPAGRRRPPGAFLRGGEKRSRPAQTGAQPGHGSAAAAASPDPPERRHRGQLQRLSVCGAAGPGQLRGQPDGLSAGHPGL